MGDNPTREIPGSDSFEERVFARFDSLDARMERLETKVDALDGRLTTLEEKVDSRLRETRPIWEDVLARLTGVESELARMNRQFRSYVADIFQLRVRVEKLEEDADTRTA
ncbi:MAG TPA: hypothetical protein VF588_16990 [Pyrinomonadaceae bacterium]|jgi:chromosome segregation ATPase